MKKLVALLMAGVMVFGFAACGNKDNNDGGNQGNEQNNEVKVDVADATELFNKGRSCDLLLLERDHGTVPSVPTGTSLYPSRARGAAPPLTNPRLRAPATNQF